MFKFAVNFKKVHKMNRMLMAWSGVVSDYRGLVEVEFAVHVYTVPLETRLGQAVCR